MKNKPLLVALLFAFGLPVAWGAEKPVVAVLLGQSNMVGFGGRVSELPEGERSLPANCRLILKGQPVRFEDEKFCGPEWGFARELTARYPGREIILFKWAVSATSTMAWLPGIEAGKRNASPAPADRGTAGLYARVLAGWKSAFPDGTVPDAILWMQGETDARYEELKSGYPERMEQIITALRNDLRCPDAPFLMGQINPAKEKNFEFADEVRAAQQALAARIPNVYLVATEGLTKRADAVHYDTPGEMELGRRFAQEFLKTGTNNAGEEKMKSKSILTAISLGCALGAQAANSLESRFAQPPMASRPASWHFWMAGNISEWGLKDSFENMEKTGIGSVEVMQLNSYGGRTPEGPVTVLSPEWRALFDRYFELAKEKGMAATLFTTETGWSMMGDAKVEPVDSSKRLTSTETMVEGGQAEPIRLPQPEGELKVYKDLTVVAFPEPAGAGLPVPVIESAPKGAEWAKLTDGNWKTGVKLPGNAVQLVLAYPNAVEVKSLKFWMQTWSARPKEVTVEVEDGGTGWKQIGLMDTYWPFGSPDLPLIIRLEPATAKRFRVTFKNGNNTSVNGIELSGANFVDLFNSKAGYTQRREHGGGADLIRASAQRWAATENLPGLDPAAVIDLTDKLAPDGTLNWTPPSGRWRVIRIGWTTCGHKAGPSPEGVRCYIIDPVGKNALQDYWSRFPASTIAKHGPKNGGPVTSVELDSWEAGNLNWSTDFPQEFQKRRGYSMVAYWPLLASGYVVSDALSSERFLRDFRLTLAELISERYYGETARMAHQDGVELWAEACGRQQFAYHPTEYLRHADVPMGEFWVNEGRPRTDCRSAASMANFYGHPKVAGESFTATDDDGNFDNGPADFKRLGDEAFVEGINHFMLILNTLTPYKGPSPGVVCATIGSQMINGNTWWGTPARGWTDYLSRCQDLLQQGRNVSDILYFAGEDFPAELPLREKMTPVIPSGIDYDICGPAELLKHLKVEKGGTLVSPGGARYRILMLRDWQTMSAEIAQKLRELVGAGAVVVGPPPQRAAGLADAQKGDQTVRDLARDLWGTADSKAVVDRKVGKGRVIWNKTLPEIFAVLNLTADFAPPAGRDLRFRHRSVEGAEFYFVSNQEEKPFAGELGFRVAGKRPELWDPINGTTRKLDYWTEQGGLTQVPVELGRFGSVFVVFRENGKPSGKPPVSPAAAPGYISGPWKATFQKDRGAPAEIALDTLAPLNHHNDTGVKYFSGTATYRTEFDWQPETGNLKPR